MSCCFDETAIWESTCTLSRVEQSLHAVAIAHACARYPETSLETQDLLQRFSGPETAYYRVVHPATLAETRYHECDPSIVISMMKKNCAYCINQ
jgi:hypothetical protein